MTQRHPALTVADVMTTQVITVTPDSPLLDAIRLMLNHRISGLPVVDADGALHGLLSEGDLLRRAEIGTGNARPRWMTLFLDSDTVARDFVRSHGRQVRDVMTEAVVWVGESTPLTDAVEAMEKCHIKRLPVVKDGRLVGLVTRVDILHALVNHMSERPLSAESDRAIRRQLGDTLNRLSWENGKPRFQVNEGVVDLYWIDRSADWERAAARVAAETTAGVREVREHIIEH